MNVVVILCDTLRYDHCGPYHQGRPLNACGSLEQPDWVVPTPNLDRLAERGTVYENAYCGSSPCMPARRDIYTGRYEFLERGWGPLEHDDQDLPRQISGPRACFSLSHNMRKGYHVSQLISDHFHLWEQGSGNYHMGFSGFEFVRGIEADNWITAPSTLEEVPEASRDGIDERYFRQKDRITGRFPQETFDLGTTWLQENHAHKDWFLHIDCFPPHEPWDPPREFIERFDPTPLEEGAFCRAPYAKWDEFFTAKELRHYQARYAATVAWTDHCLGKFLDKMDALDLWKDTLVILTSDHGTFNGDHGRTGKLQTHQFDAIGHIPFIMCHPELGHGERRSQLVQLVDIYPTTLQAIGRPLPDMPAGKPLHGVDLLPTLADPNAPTRTHAIMGQFGKSFSMTDGTWVLHQSPGPENQPLHWYGHQVPRYLHMQVSAFKEAGYYPVIEHPSWPTPTWLSNRTEDPNELTNLADAHPEKLAAMQQTLAQKLVDLKAPPFQFERLGLTPLQPEEA